MDLMDIIDEGFLILDEEEEDRALNSTNTTISGIERPDRNDFATEEEYFEAVEQWQFEEDMVRGGENYE